MGKETANELVKRGANVVLAVRSIERGEGAMKSFAPVSNSDTFKHAPFDASKYGSLPVVGLRVSFNSDAGSRVCQNNVTRPRIHAQRS